MTATQNQPEVVTLVTAKEEAPGMTLTSSSNAFYADSSFTPQPPPECTVTVWPPSPYPYWLWQPWVPPVWTPPVVVEVPMRMVPAIVVPPCTCSEQRKLRKKIRKLQRRLTRLEERMPEIM